MQKRAAPKSKKQMTDGVSQTVSNSSSSVSPTTAEVNHKQPSDERAQLKHLEAAKEIKSPQIVPTKNKFEPRTSYLDPSQSESALQRSEFKGFFNLLALMGGFYVLTSNISYFIREGTLVGLQSLVKLVPIDMVPAWILLGASSFSAFFIQKLILLNILPKSAIFLMQHLIQSIIFLGTLWLLVFEKEWAVVPTTCFLLHMIILVMKMHSYTETNREFAAAALNNSCNNNRKCSTDQQKGQPAEVRTIPPAPGRE